MGNETKQLFRDKSLEKAESPENINSYIRVISPGVWAVIVAIIIAAVGLLVWAVFGTVDSKANSEFRAEESGKAIIYVNESEISGITKGSLLMINGVKGKVTRISKEPKLAGDVMDGYLMHINGINSDTWVYEVHTNITVDTGINSAEFIKETISPISFILGN